MRGRESVSMLSVLAAARLLRNLLIIEACSTSYLTINYALYPLKLEDEEYEYQRIPKIFKELGMGLHSKWNPPPPTATSAAYHVTPDVTSLRPPTSTR